MKKIVRFDNKGNIIDFDKRSLKKHKDYGYYIEDGNLIHYFNNNKMYERSKIR